jgi:hypothetical protein
MGRLVTFGCSLTFGYALSDTWPYREIYNASNLAWPGVLGSKLNLEVVNKGNPGAGQTEIFSNVLDSKFEPDDTVITMWSYFDRLEFYKFLEPSKGLRILQDHSSYRNFVILSDKYRTDIARRNWLIIQHASLYFKEKNMKHVSILALEDRFNHPNTLYKIDVPDIIQDISWNYLDKALDKVHPGIESHKDMAEQIYNKVFNVVY